MITLGDVGGVRLRITGDNSTCPSLYLTISAFTISVLTICPPWVVEIADGGLSISYDLLLSLPRKWERFTTKI